MSVGWRQQLADVVTAIRSTLADAAHAGSMSAADFLKLAGLPSSAVPTTRTIGTTPPLTGGGDLSANRTLAISAASGAAAGSMSAADFSKLALYPADPRISGAAFMIGVWQTGLIDLTAAPATYQVVPAAPAGLIFVPLRVNLMLVNASGTMTTQPTVKGGNNATNDNIFAAAQFPNSTTFGQGPGAMAQFATPLAGLYTQNAVNIQVTVSAAGAGLVCKARYIVSGQFLDFT